MQLKQNGTEQGTTAAEADRADRGHKLAVVSPNKPTDLNIQAPSVLFAVVIAVETQEGKEGWFAMASSTQVRTWHQLADSHRIRVSK